MRNPTSSHRLIVLVALAFAAATVGIAGTAASGATTTTLDLTGTITSFHVALDAKPAGQSPGDIGYLVGNLFKDGKPYGRFQGVCTQFPHSGSQCSFSLGLPAGQILLQSAYGAGFNTGSVAREAINGGTGAFASARGQGIDREVTDTRLALHLELSS
jgi:hypothetical protein